MTEKYAPAADRWSDTQYADSTTYLRRRADLIVELGPRLGPGDIVCDLACGDGGLAEFLFPHGLRYIGVDAGAEMAAAARRRLEGRARVEQADLNDFHPGEHVQATTVFRAVYYARDFDEFFRHVASYTEKKFVFDLNPRQYDLDDVLRRLRAAGLGRVDKRPFFVPQRVALPRPVAALARAAERSGALARLALRYRFTYLIAASR